MLPVNMTPQRTLWCAAGQHNWNRPAQKGATPFSCPEHRKPRSRKAVTAAQPVAVVFEEPYVFEEPVQQKPVLKLVEESAVPKSAREKTIQRALDTRGSCTCKIDFTMDDDALMSVISCTDGFVCSVLDRIRRQVVDYTLPDLTFTE